MSFLDDYEPVEDRLAKFWEDHPDGQIVTEMLPAPEGQWIVKASVWRTRLWRELESTMYVSVEDGPDGVGHAHEHVTAKGVNSTSALENCETSAIGRALANLGYAAKGKRPSREEMITVRDSKGKVLEVREPEPTRPDYAVWLADQVEIFKAWDEDERKLAYAAAMNRLGYKIMDDMHDAKAIFAEMQVIYETRPLQPDALPLEDK